VAERPYVSDRLRIGRLAARGFRNLQPLELAPGPCFNVVHGDNGAGKSNLLEVIYYLGSLRSFRGARTDDMVALTEPASRFEARVLGEAAPRTYRVGLERGRARQLALDGKRPRSIATWHGSIHMVLFHPGDVLLAGGPPEGRRALLDRILEQVDPAYGPALAAYTKALRSRNRLLRQEPVSRKAVQAYDGVLARSGAEVGQRRIRIVEELADRASAAFAEVVGEALPLEVKYRPRVDPDAQAIAAALERAFDKDVARGFTADGPHADDLGLELRQVAARHHASQGQQRAIVLALKVAELDVLTRRTGKVPILLLDDVSSELDRARNRRLFELLGRLGGQVFLTTTHPEFILLDHDRVDFHVKSGQISVTP
jgi:DNA replication and repair protein RecF